MYVSKGITRGLSDALKKLRGRGRLTEANIREGLRKVRRALLEADVNFTVVNTFIARVEERSVGQDVLTRVDPSEQIVKIVYDELVQLMGPVDQKIRFAKDRPTILMMCGLQGSGQNHHVRQVRPHAAEGRPKAVARRGRLAASRRRRTIEGPGRTDQDSRL